MNIHARFSATLERFVKELVLGLKGASSIGRLKYVYRVLIVVSQLLQLVVDAHYISKAIMLFSIIRGFDQICKKKFLSK